MKKTLAKGLALAVLGTALAAGSAWATPMLTLSDGITTISITDGGVGDVNPGVGEITFIGGVGNWTSNVSTGQSPMPGSTVFPHFHLNSIDNTSSTGGTLTITLTDTPVWSPGTTGFDFLVGGTVANKGTISFDALVDGASMSPLGPFTNAFSATNSFAATGTDVSIVAEITHAVSGGTSFDAELRPVPEPATMLLLGTGLVGLAGVGRKRMKKA